ncbi:helix-turn-helix domain-containing protein [Donghicola mangrovi]|uniref:Cupin domain-containing protein n=1 Tax=Donghicola mangrovi TaxID=2729614 RepID=A0A850QGT7_9RHOB|nr:XRE family transcriptional regulator [Donghicola mangrovi]NVO25041.1 cupin domain-containing protein [Donghicola mangrovi]
MQITAPAPHDKSTGPKLGALIRKRRKGLGLTLQGLSEASGVSVGYVSQIERDLAVPTLGTLAQLAEGLDVRLEYFIKTHKPTDAISRADTREKFSLAGSSITYEALSNDYSGSEMSSYIMHVPAGYQSETVSHEGEEIIYMLEGQVEWTLDGQRFTMNVGDSLHYSGTVPHAWSNPTDTAARILWTGTLSVLSPDDQRRLPPATIEGDG